MIKQYFTSIYERYNKIIIHLPTGFGTNTNIFNVIMQDLSVNCKSCLIMIPNSMFSKNYYDELINLIPNNVGIYRKGENKYIEFNNGSLIEVITYHNLITNRLSSRYQDILYITGYGTNSLKRINDELCNLIDFYKKIIVVNSSTNSIVIDKMKSDKNYYCKDITSRNINELSSDIKSELRFDKIQKIKNEIKH